MVRRWQGLTAAMLVLLLVLAGCGSKQKDTVIEDASSPSKAPASSAGQKEKITFWDDNAGPERTPIYEELIKRFQEQNPTIAVEYVGLPASTAKQKLDASIAASELPDVSGLVQGWVSDFVMKEALLPLDSYFNGWSEKANLSAGIIQSLRNTVPDEKLYMIPMIDNPDLLWYRADWFKDKGIGKLDSWDQFFKAVESLTDKGKGIYGYSIRGGQGGAFQLYHMMYLYSGIPSFFDKNGKSTINDPKHIEFLKRYAALYKNFTPESDITNAYKEMVAGFDTGKVAIVQHNLGSFAQHSQSLPAGSFLGTTAPPSVQGYPVKLGGDIRGVAVYKKTKHPEAAWKFASFLNSPESLKYWAEKTGTLPVNGKVLQDSYIQNTQHLQAASKLISDPKTVVVNPPIHLPDFDSYLNGNATTGFQEVLAGKKTPEAYLNEWAASLEKSYADYNKFVKK